jgi:SAM-dependent methyltransferase
LADICYNSKILDLGSLFGAAGAYALHNNARHYTGVSAVQSEIKITTELFEKYFHSDSYELYNMLFEDYFEKFDDVFDIVLILNVIYGQADHRKFLEDIALRCRKYLVIETLGIHPIEDTDIPTIIYKAHNLMPGYPWDGMDKKGIVSYCPNEFSCCSNLAFWNMILKPLDFTYLPEYTVKSKQSIPKRYNLENRYLAVFERNH